MDHQDNADPAGDDADPERRAAELEAENYALRCLIAGLLTETPRTTEGDRPAPHPQDRHARPQAPHPSQP